MCSQDDRLHFGRYSPIPDSRISQVIFSLYKSFHNDNDEKENHRWNNMIVKICNDLNISRDECLDCLEKEKEKQHNIQQVYANQKFNDLDFSTLALIRRHIHEYYIRGEHPSRNDLLDSLKTENIFHGTILELRHIVKKLGFTYKLIEGKMLLWEKNKIANERENFLKILHNNKLENIIWIGETVFNIKSADSNDEEVINKEWKVIILSAVCIEGFIESITKVHVTDDINKEFNSIEFTDWFEEQLMPSLNSESIVILENSLNHRHILDKAPSNDDEFVTKEVIKNWLKQNMIDFDDSFTKAELLCLVDVYKSLVPRYTIDYTAKLFGHQVLRYPINHNHFNPFHLIINEIKNNITCFDLPVTLQEAENLIKQSITQLTPDKWKNAIDKSNSIIEEAWNYELLLKVAKNIIKSELQECNNSVNDNDEDLDESISELSDETTQYSYDTDIDGERSDSSDSM
ncbi:hypothetical protein O3M35_009401 [Rhynocoris fuscipes]|uniref:Uncharacterized protein n=1 Tax=Rhynocoris fuscipes TaxID=488301 RepID=A0AAW1D8Q6_9HEMI